MPDFHALPRGGVRTLLAHVEQPGLLSIEMNPTGRVLLLAQPGSEDSPQAGIWFKDGLIYAASLATFQPPLARRLRATGAVEERDFTAIEGLPAEDVATYAVEKLGIARGLLDELHRELLLSTVTHLFDWDSAVWVWEPTVTTARFVTSPMPASLVASAADERIGQWSAVARNFPYVTQPGSVPKAGPGWAAKTGGEVTPELAALLMNVDGKRSVSQIASLCGFTRFEVTRLLAAATADKILVFPDARNLDPTLSICEMQRTG